MVKQTLQIEARRMRGAGCSIKEIADQLNISKSTASNWVRDIILTREQHMNLMARKQFIGELNAGAKAQRDKNLRLRMKYQEEGRIHAQQGSKLHLTGCMLYWAEGEKSSNGVYFVNSDANMLILFTKFLRLEMNVPENNITIRIHCHTNIINEIKLIEDYWLDILQLPTSSLRKTTIKEGGKSTIKRLPNGVCGIKVHSTRLLQHIYGAIQEYGGFENPAWLG